MRFSEMPENSHRQRLATTGIAKALRGLFHSVSRAEDWGKVGTPRCGVRSARRADPTNLQCVKKFVKLRRCRAGDDAPESALVLNDVAFSRVFLRKFDDAPRVKGALCRGTIGIDFLQNPVDPRMNRFFDQ